MYILTRLLILVWGGVVVGLIVLTISKIVVGKAPKNIFKAFTAILIWPILALTKNGRQILLKDINQQ